jgi:hypothetical protein
MAVDFSAQVYLPGQNTFGRAIIVNGAVIARGILDTREIDVVAIDGSIVSEQRTILDVRDAEFNTVPVQGDHIAIPADGTLPDEGTWEVIDSARNGGGETTLTLRKLVTAKPTPALKLVKGQ